MKKYYLTMIFIWLTILSIISILSLVRSFYHNVTLGIDYSGILVGILAALCTVLIGWQIFTLVDLNKREQKNLNYISSLKSIIEGMHENNNRGNYLMYDNLAELYEDLLNDDKEKYAFQFIHFKIKAIRFASRIKDYEICKLGVKHICIFIYRNNIVFDKDQRHRLYESTYSIPDQNMIENFTDLIDAIGNIKT